MRASTMRLLMLGSGAATAGTDRVLLPLKFHANPFRDPTQARAEVASPLCQVAGLQQSSISLRAVAERST